MKVQNEQEQDEPMTSRERFLTTMRLGAPDRVPCFDEGLRPEVIKAWQGQGLSSEGDLYERVSMDRKETLETDLYPIPDIVDWPEGVHQLGGFKDKLDPFDPKRLPEAWPEKMKTLPRREHALFLYVHEGFFLTMGVMNWKRFLDVMYLLKDQPGLVRKMMRIQVSLRRPWRKECFRTSRSTLLFSASPSVGMTSRLCLRPCTRTSF